MGGREGKKSKVHRDLGALVSKLLSSIAPYRFHIFKASILFVLLPMAQLIISHGIQEGVEFLALVFGLVLFVAVFAIVVALFIRSDKFIASGA